ncbi:NitT/TauT family transport system substrate-binding protein [Quadrisphaera granulorum]|uniref:NitT/TauT family transport system substrate-binding protein n=1 Tax=Quadrisphaera granulorum TaxID=317664 RepID=A0A316AFS3_9ACTN|nr:ABC transporter substrate-binding protein [Quadrisphaera granulorum]PWJ56108.1 NitT/TauT family transport system substrate-binding protein [Quadrisphaera granulorum]SZE94742.1 NitT/TauT family transport system substrate-binding protein [Quadrisphaera granulorum]
MPNPHSYPSVGPPASGSVTHQHQQSYQQFRLSRRAVLGSLGAFAVLPVLAACGSRPVESTSAATSAAPTTGGTAAAELRLGLFPNVTHAAALAGIAQGYFAEALGSTKFSTQAFNAGPAAIEALTAGAIDATYIGPSPAINAFSKSGGTLLRIIAGACSGGAQLVVQPGITSAEQLRGKQVASPQLGGTQDVALRTWLAGQGLATTTSGTGGDVTITPTENSSTLDLFRQGRLEGAWLPEPWASRLVLDAGATVLVDEKSLWPDGKFLTTHLIVSTEFLAAHPETVKALLEGHVKAVDWAASDPGAPAAVNEQIKALTTKALSEAVIARAFSNLTITDDPLASTLPKLLEDAVAAGTTKTVDLQGIYDLRLLNEVLTAAGAPKVSAAGLGEE